MLTFRLEENPGDPQRQPLGSGTLWWFGFNPETLLRSITGLPVESPCPSRPEARPSGKQKVDAIGLLRDHIVVSSPDGRKRKKDPFEIGLEQLARKAMKKDLAAAAEFIELCLDAGLFSQEDAKEWFNGSAPREWSFSAWVACFNAFGPPPWDLPMDGLIPEERRKETLRRLYNRAG